MHQIEFFGVTSQNGLLLKVYQPLLPQSKDLGEIFHYLVPLSAMDPRGTT
jgi:hypothetical protein